MDIHERESVLNQILKEIEMLENFIKREINYITVYANKVLKKHFFCE